MEITGKEGNNPGRGIVFLFCGIVAFVTGVLMHDWSLQYLLRPTTPFRLTARVHWWFISLITVGIGIWLIIWRNQIRPVLVAAVALSYGMILVMLVSIDLLRGYRIVTDFSERKVSGEFMVLDDEFGWTVKPKSRARVTQNGVYDVSYEIDEEGFRRTIPNRPASQRIFVLGDSFAFGWGVNDDETFSSCLAKLVDGQAKVVNAAVEGFGITQIYVKALRILPKIRPNDIVIFTFIEDDIERNWSDFMFVSRMQFLSRPIRKFPVYENGMVHAVEVGNFRDRFKAVLLYSPWLGSVFGPLLLPAPELALKDAEQMVTQVQELVQARGAKVLLVQLPTGAELQRKSALLPPVRFGAYAARDKFPQHEGGTYFLSREDGHFSPKGHSLVCNILYGKLLNLLQS